MNLEEFTLNRFVVEWRFGTRYALWDRAGRIAAELAVAYPGLDLNEGMPNKQVFARINTETKSHEWSLEAQLGRLNVVFHRPKQRFVDLAPTLKAILSIYTKALDIDAF